MKSLPDEVFPCNGCTACCRRETLALFPEHGDDVASYETEPEMRVHPGTGRDHHVLAHQPNGDCIYVGESECTIWERRPWACRKFNCVDFFARLGDELDGMAAVASGRVSEAVWFAAQSRKPKGKAA